MMRPQEFQPLDSAVITRFADACTPHVAETLRPNLPHAPVRRAPGLWPRFLGRSTHRGRGIPLPGALHAVTPATRALKGSR
jgi:hypothetical protein